MTFGKILSREKLKTEYWDKEKSLRDIALDIGCNDETIRKWMIKYDIPRRKAGNEERLKKYRFKKGHVSSNKGLTGSKSHLWGKHHTKATKEKMSEAQKGEKHYMWGKHYTKEASEKMSEACRGLNRRENNPNWKGGVTFLGQLIRNSFKYRQWRSDVFTRDDFTCQECSRRGIYINAHHKEALADIIEFNDIKTYQQAMDCEELWNINNGVTLCEKCHDLTKKGRPIHEFFGNESARL